MCSYFYLSRMAKARMDEKTLSVIIDVKTILQAF